MTSFTASSLATDLVLAVQRDAPDDGLAAAVAALRVRVVRRVLRGAPARVGPKAARARDAVREDVAVRSATAGAVVERELRRGARPRVADGAVPSAHAR